MPRVELKERRPERNSDAVVHATFERAHIGIGGDPDFLWRWVTGEEIAAKLASQLRRIVLCQARVVAEVVHWRGVLNPDPAGELPQTERCQPLVLDHLDGGLDKRAAQIARDRPLSLVRSASS